MVLVSEIMLQQTQVSRVQILFKKFLKRFPTVHDLASASNRDVLIEWRGLGYNSRALRLRDAAKQIVSRGSFPTEMDDLLSIGGVGHYTAAAIRNFAFNIPTPCLDTNIRRILHRSFIGPENPDGTWKKDDRYLQGLAEEVLAFAMKNSKGLNSADWHAALMDFGSIICTKRNPKWDLCPLTARGLMKAAYKVKVDVAATKKKKKEEPGRLVGSVFVPNRIFRGKVVEALRDAGKGMTLDTIGRTACIDWEETLHRAWLQSLLQKLKRDGLVRSRSTRWMLAE